MRWLAFAVLVLWLGTFYEARRHGQSKGWLPVSAVTSALALAVWTLL